MRVVIDTNILISATLWSGESDRIIKKAENSEIELCLSEEILEEYAEVLKYPEILEKIRDNELEVKMTLAKIKSISIIFNPKLKINDCKDKKDNKILECALESNADFIITYDNHLLEINEFHGTKILNPSAFLSLFNKF
jgi:putative PIN family toxin of toxin-antitoxin system